MADAIRVRWSGGDRSFEPGAPATIGREPGNTVELSNPAVSRRHAVLEHGPGGWSLRDLGSAQGTWQGGRRLTSIPLNGNTTVSLGQPPGGEVLEFSPERPASAATSGVEGTVLPPPPPRPVEDTAGTVVVGATPDRPGGRLREGAVSGATVVTGAALNVECAGRSYSFQPGQTVSVGRDDDCDIVSTNPTVSRHHAQLRHDGTGWLFEDSGSAGGTFLDGERIRERRLSGSTALWLGSPDAGERVVLVTSGPTAGGAKKRNGNRGAGWVLAAAGVAMVVVFLAALAFVVNRSDGPDSDKLAKGTVKITTEASIENQAGAKGKVSGTGSGTIIDAEKGLVLTNAHVVEPRATGLEPEYLADEVTRVPNPEVIEISVTDRQDDPVEPSYFAEVVAVDGYLDLAVVQIKRTMGGKSVGPSDLQDLTEIPIGDSDDVFSGDRVTVVGFPGVADSQGATLTKGVISGVVAEPSLDLDRAFFNTDAEINSGNSGGLAADDDGRLIGVPTLVRFTRSGDGGRFGVIRPVNLALELIKAAKNGETYESPYG